MSRAHLFNRRACQSFEIAQIDPSNGHEVICHMTVGTYPDHKTVGEVFITVQGESGKGSMLEAVARDAAILISLAIQHGATIPTLRGSMTRDKQGRPMTLIGAVLDAMEG